MNIKNILDFVFMFIQLITETCARNARKTRSRSEDKVKIESVEFVNIKRTLDGHKQIAV